MPDSWAGSAGGGICPWCSSCKLEDASFRQGSGRSSSHGFRRGGFRENGLRQRRRRSGRRTKAKRRLPFGRHEDSIASFTPSKFVLGSHSVVELVAKQLPSVAAIGQFFRRGCRVWS